MSYSEFNDDIKNKNFYKEHQNRFLWFVNSFFGRRYLRINSPYKVTEVFSNGLVFDRGNIKEYRFYTVPYIDIKLAPYIKIATFEMPRLFEFPQIELVKAISLANFSVGAGGGDVREDTTAQAWATKRSQTTGTAVRDQSSDSFDRMHATKVGSDFELGRVSLITDTSALNDSASISAATWTIASSANSITDTYKYCLVGNTQVSDTLLATADFDDLIGSSLNTPTEYATRVDVTGASQTAVLTLNANGLAAISKTGYTKMALRSNMDIDNSDPTGQNTIRITWGSTFLSITSSSPSVSASPSSSSSSSASRSASASLSPSSSASASASRSASSSASRSLSPSASQSQSASASISPSPSTSSSASASPSPARFTDLYSSVGNSYIPKYTDWPNLP